MKKIRVLHLTSTRYGIGGVEKLLLDMSDKYDPDRFDVFYCNLFCDADGQGVFPAAMRQRGLSVYEVKGRSLSDIPQMVSGLARLLRQERFDILHLHMLQATIVGGLAVKFARGTKVVVTKHYTDDLSSQNPVVKRLGHHYTRMAGHIIAISEHVKADMVRISIPVARITVIYNGTDIEHFDRRAAVPSHLEPAGAKDRLLIGTVGSLTPRKGHRHLIEAMPEIVKELGSVHLFVIGEGPEKQELEQLRVSLGLESVITMLGFQDEVAPLLTELDLYVHPSIHEPFGIAILEAMAARKCVVATAVGGVPEIVLDGVTGYLVPPGEPAALSNTISNALRHRDKAIEMGRAGRERVADLFDIQRTVKGYEDLYNELCGYPGRTRPADGSLD